MFNNLKKFHQARTQNLNNMFNQNQARHQNQQMGGMGYNQTQMRGQQGYRNPNPYNGMGGRNMNNMGNPQRGQNMQQQGSFFGNSQSYNRNHQVINYLNRIKGRVVQDLEEAGRHFKDHSNFNNSSDLCLLIEVFIKVNSKNVGVMVKMKQTFPKNIPTLKMKETFVHDEIDRSNNRIRVENFCTWNTNKKIPDLITEVENYFKISPPENSPELQELISNIVKINKAILTLKNFNYASFQHRLYNDQKQALANGDYLCLKESQDYKTVKAMMFEVSDHLKNMKLEVHQLQSEIKDMSQEKKEVIEKFQEKLAEFEQVKMNHDDLNLKYDSENIKKFLQNQVNKLMYQKEELKQKMLECDVDDLADLQEEHLKTSKNLSRYATLMEKAFAF